MSILVTGASGTIGSLVVQGLARAGAPVKALVRTPGKATLPPGASEIVGDFTDLASLRLAMQEVRTLFLLNAVTPDEVTQAMLALNAAREAGIERIVYLSVIHAERYANVPHFAGKYTVERMIEALDLPVTILRPAYFMQNDIPLQAAIEQYGAYPMPVGSAGVAMVDTRDIAEVAVLELLRRHRADKALPRLTLDLAGPDALDGAALAALWSEALQREVHYGGDDTRAFEAHLGAHAPAWLAYDMRLMMEGIQQQGMRPAADSVQRVREMLGRPLRSYRAMLAELRQAGQLRQFVQGMRAEYRATVPMAGAPDPVRRVETIEIPAGNPARSIALRLYAPLGADGDTALPMVLFAHGGGFVSGDFDTHDVLARAIANRAQALVLAVDYRLAPEAPFPAGLQDVYAALQWAQENAARIGGDPARIAISGDSAGGNLAAAAALMARDLQGPHIAAQWLMYPMLSTSLDSDSWQRYGAQYFPTREVATSVLSAYAGQDDMHHPLVTPLLAQHAGLPPALVQVGSLDPLLDEGVAYARKLQRSGVAAQSIVYEGQTHGFMQFFKDKQQNALGERALDEGIAFLQSVFQSMN